MLALAETFAAFKDQTGCSLADGGQGSPCQTNGNEEADEVAGVIEEAKWMHLRKADRSPYVPRKTSLPQRSFSAHLRCRSKAQGDTAGGLRSKGRGSQQSRRIAPGRFSLYKIGSFL